MNAMNALRTNFAVALALAAATSSCFAPTQAEDELPGPEMSGAVVADADNVRSAMASVLLPVAPEEAAAWITQADRLDRWLGEKVEMGGVGDRFVVGYPSTGQQWVGKLLELDRSGRLVAEVQSAVVPSLLTLTLDHHEEGGFQRVTFTVASIGKEMADEVVADGFREGMTEALKTLRLAAAGEKTAPTQPPVVARVFHPLVTPREGLEAEIKMKNPPKPVKTDDSPANPPK